MPGPNRRDARAMWASRVGERTQAGQGQGVAPRLLSSAGEQWHEQCKGQKASHTVLSEK